MIVFAFPAIILATALLELERAFGWPFFAADTRRRSAAVAAPLLVLRPSRGLHHLPAGRRHGLDDRADDGADAARRLPAGRAGAARHRLPQLRPVGAPHVRDRHPARCRSASSRRRAWRWRSRAASRCSRGSRRSPPGSVQFNTPTLFVLGFLVHLRARRADRRDGRGRAVRLAGARHLLRRRAPALRADRRHGVSAVRGVLLLDAVRQQARAVGAPRPLGVRADVRRLQRRVLPDAHHRTRRHAAARVHLPAGLGWDALNLVSTRRRRS